MEKDFSFLQHLTEVRPEEQRYDSIPSEQLWLFQMNGEIKGPFIQQDIISLIPKFRSEFAQVHACQMRDKIWKPFFDHICFDLRKLDFASRPKFRSKELDSTEYLFLSNGVKKGPINNLEIIELIDLQEVKPDTLVSADGGKTWHRAYFYPQFDRRSRGTLRDEDLILPRSEDVEKSGILSHNAARKKMTVNFQVEDSLSAESGLLQSKKIFEKERDEEKQQKLLEQEMTLTSFSIDKMARSFVQEKKKVYGLIAIGTVFLIFGLTNQSQKPHKKESNELSPLVSIPNSIKDKPTIKYEDLTPPNSPIPESTMEAAPPAERNMASQSNDTPDDREAIENEYPNNEDENEETLQTKNLRKPASKNSPKKIVITHGTNKEKPYSADDQDEAELDNNSSSDTEDSGDARLD